MQAGAPLAQEVGVTLLVLLNKCRRLLDLHQGGWHVRTLGEDIVAVVFEELDYFQGFPLDPRVELLDLEKQVYGFVARLAYSLLDDQLLVYLFDDVFGGVNLVGVDEELEAFAEAQRQEERVLYLVANIGCGVIINGPLVGVVYFEDGAFLAPVLPLEEVALEIFREKRFDEGLRGGLLGLAARVLAGINEDVGGDARAANNLLLPFVGVGENDDELKFLVLKMTGAVPRCYRKWC